MRSAIRNDETVSSVTNFINPWETETRREIFSGQKLDQMIQEHTRKVSQRKVSRLRKGRKLQTPKDLKDLGKRSNQYKKKMFWKRTLRKYFFSTHFKYFIKKKSSLIFFIFCTLISKSLNIQQVILR